MSNHYCPDCGQHHEDNHHGVRGAAVGRGASVGAPFATLRNLRTVEPSRATQAQTNPGYPTARFTSWLSIPGWPSGERICSATMQDGTIVLAHVPTNTTLSRVTGFVVGVLPRSGETWASSRVKLGDAVIIDVSPGPGYVK